MTREGVSPDVTAVIANITVVTPDGDNHLTARPCESATDTVPNTSMLNYNRAWSATPNTSVQTLSDTGLLCVNSYAAANLIIDVNALVRGQSGHALPGLGLEHEAFSAAGRTCVVGLVWVV